MTDLYKVVVHNPGDVAWEDDSFAEGWTEFYVTMSRDGDIVKIQPATGYSSGCIEKTGFSVEASTYKYLVVCLKGTAQYYIEVYDGSWKIVCAYPDAPSEYNIVTYDLSSITTGTVTGIHLGVYGGESEKTWYDFAAFAEVQPTSLTEKLISLKVLHRETDLDEFELLSDHQTSNPFVHGEHLRVWLEAVKVFAGIIEEVTPDNSDGRTLYVGGRCFGQKLLLRTKSKNFSSREVSQAVKDLVEDLAEVSTFQVETPSPTVTVTKDLKYEYIMDGLQDLAKQAGSDWEVKLGMGHDLSFRSRQSGNVPTVPVTITEGTHILKGVRKEKDALRLFNKVTVLGGPLYNDDGDPDKWTESTSGWTCWPDGSIAAQSEAPVGSYFLRVSFTNEHEVLCYRSISSIDVTKYESLKLYCRHSITGDPWNVWVEIGQGQNNCKHFPLKALGGGYVPSDHMTELEIPMDHPAWGTTGSPDLTDVTWICIHPAAVDVGGYISGNLDFDGFHLYKPTLTKEATDSNSSFTHTREYIHRDERIINPDFAQEVADALLAVLKSEENRITIPIVGTPTVQAGHKVTVNSPTNDLDGTYHIVEAEHRVTPEEGYVTEMVLEKPRFYLEKLLSEAINKRIKLIERGGIA